MSAPADLSVAKALSAWGWTVLPLQGGEGLPRESLDSINKPSVQDDARARLFTQEARPPTGATWQLVGLTDPSWVLFVVIKRRHAPASTAAGTWRTLFGEDLDPDTPTVASGSRFSYVFDHPTARTGAQVRIDECPVWFEWAGRRERRGIILPGSCTAEGMVSFESGGVLEAWSKDPSDASPRFPPLTQNTLAAIHEASSRWKKKTSRRTAAKRSWRTRSAPRSGTRWP